MTATDITRRLTYHEIDNNNENDNDILFSLKGDYSVGKIYKQTWNLKTGKKKKKIVTVNLNSNMYLLQNNANHFNLIFFNQ